MRINHPELFCSRDERTDDNGPASAALGFMNTEESKRIGVVAAQNKINV